MIPRLLKRLTRSASRSQEARAAPAAPSAARPAVGDGGPLSAIGRLGDTNLRTFGAGDGVPQSTVIDVCFDREGYLWVGTEEGPARYDGRSFKAVTLPRRTVSSFVRSVCPSRDGAIWFGTHGGGLYRLDRGAWQVFDAASSPLPDDIVITVREGLSQSARPPLYVGTRRGLAIFDGGSWRVVDAASGLPNDVVMCLHESAAPAGDVTLWVGTRSGLARRRRGVWECVTDGAGLPCDSFLSLAETVEPDGRTVLWGGTARAGLVRYDGESWRVLDTSSGLPDNRVYCILPVSDRTGAHGLWVGTQQGIVRLDETGRVVEEIARLRDTGILTLCETPERFGGGALWIGTDGRGVLRKGPDRWISFTRASGLADDLVTAIAETGTTSEDRQIWVGGDTGLSRSDGTAWAVDRDGPARLVRSLVAVDGGAALLAGSSQDGCLRLSEGEWARLGDEQLPGNAINCSCVTTDGDGERTIWFGTDAGLVRLDRKGWTRITTADGLPHHYVFSIASTSDRDGATSLWVGTNGGGLARYSRGRWTVYDADSGLPNNIVMSVCAVSGPDGSRSLWVGTQGGGAAMTSLDDGPPSWRVFSDETTPALPNNMVNAIRSDARARVYLFTNRGVARLTPRRPTGDDPSDWALYTFTTEDGLPSNECNAGAAYVDSLGRVWAGTVGGAAMFDPAIALEDTTPKPLHVSIVTSEDEGRRVAPGDALGHRENNLTFEFDLLSFFREADTRYRTQLVGFDAQPSAWSAEWKRMYTNLPAGRFTFKVWGRDYAGNVTGPVELPFSVKPAPWRTWWAYAAYAGAAAGAIAGGVQWRLHTLRRRTEMLEETVRRQTAELASKVDELRHSEAITREKADELARVVEQLRVAERHALAAKAEAIAAKDKAIEASHAKSVFLSNMSHELRTPLNAVLGFAQLMERDAALAGEHRDHLTAITTSGEHLLHLINDVLSLSKIEAGRLTLNVQPFDLRRTLDGVEAMLRGRTRAKGLRFEVERGQSLPHYVLGDEGKLRQVLINLLGNAVKFTEHGTITLRARWRGGIGEFEVKDTGFGIAADELAHLFEPFVQTESGRNSREGTGLGLAISRNFVQMMGGDVQVASRLGAGSVFTFDVELPEVADASDQALRRSVIALEPGQPEYRILIVDDAERNREVLVKLLSSVGFSVCEAVDGREAVALWASWQPDLILMDMRMPVMDGRTATQEIRRREAVGGPGPGVGAEQYTGPSPQLRASAEAELLATRIIALTASAFEHERTEILAVGCDDFLTKPFRESLLFEKLAQHLGARFRYGAEADAFLTDTVPLEAERLVGVSADRLAELGDAVLKGDVEQALRVVDEIAGHDPTLADELRGLVRSYRFDEIQNLLDRAAKV